MGYGIGDDAPSGESHIGEACLICARWICEHPIGARPTREACEATQAIIAATQATAPVDEAAHRHALHVMAVNASGSVDREYASRAYLALRDVFDDVRFRHGRKSTKQALLKLMASIEAEETEERRAEKAARHEAAARTGKFAELVAK